MPVVPIGLDDEVGTREYKVGLEVPEHRLVHFEMKTPLLELVMQKLLNGGHLRGQGLLQPALTLCSPMFRVSPIPQGSLPHLLAGFRRGHQLGRGLTYLLSRLRRSFAAKHNLTMLLSSFGGHITATAILVAKHRLAHSLAALRVSPASQRRLAHLFTGFRRVLTAKVAVITTPFHMSNYNRE